MKNLMAFILALSWFFVSCNNQSGTHDELYNLDTGVRSRSISFENPTGAEGQGGQAASHLGVGRKGFPAKDIAPGEKVVLCDIEGSGTIRHIWMTGGWLDKKQLLRTTIIRTYWDGQEHPSIECPLGDFMGLAQPKVTSYQSAAHSVGENAALNIWLPMPFTRKAVITLSNESDINFTLYYQVDYTINDKHNEDVGRLHVCFRRENPTTEKSDFELLPSRTGKGRYIGSVIGIRTLYPDWWGEGEIKVFMDGDTDFPTICGTGSEDYVCLSYGMQQTPFLYHGCNLNYRADSVFEVSDYVTGEPREMSHQYVSMYRWHLRDPIYWEKDCRITIQQIGWGTKAAGLFERHDDWSTATFWYEPVPSEPLPEIPSTEKRLMDLDELFR